MADNHPQLPSEPPVRHDGTKRIRSVALAGLASAGLAFLNYSLLAELLKFNYGLFVLVPIAMGLLSSAALELQIRGERKEHLWAGYTAIGLANFALLIVALEGAICVAMAMPITFGGGALGSLLGYSAAKWLGNRRRPPKLMLSFALFLPMAVVWDSAQPVATDARLIETSILIDASPAEVWPHLHNLRVTDRARSSLLRAGIAHPLAIQTRGEGVGASRSCVLSTGAMPERVTAWEPQERLEFEVLDTPPTMKEVNPFGTVDAGHLTGYFRCLKGEFRLEKRGEKTLLIARSWYEHSFGPSCYWSLWTDKIVRDIHASVMEEVKAKAEGP